MKTPLAGIKAYVELLADGDAEDEETREEFLDVINGQADRLQRLIDNLLNIARIEAGVVKVSKQSQPLNEILSEAHRVVQPAAEAKQIRLAHDLSPMYLGVLVDRDMMLQAAINLLSNAIKYTPPGGQVTLRSRLLDGEVSFEVEDTGVGLSRGRLPAGVREVLPRREGQADGPRHRTGPAAGQTHRRGRPQRPAFRRKPPGRGQHVSDSPARSGPIGLNSAGSAGKGESYEHSRAAVR